MNSDTYPTTQNASQNTFLNLALISGRVCAWEWDLKSNEITLLGQFASFSSTEPTKYSWEEFLKIIYPADRELITASMKDALSNGFPFEIEFRVIDKNEVIQWIAGNGHTINEKPNQGRMIGIFYNTSDRRKKADLLSKRQAKFANLVRLSSIGEMASIISHEISQPLVVINTYIAGCIRRLEEATYDKDQIILAMKKANEYVELTGSLIHRMKNYIRKDSLNFEKVNIHEIIESATSLLAYENAQFPIVIEYDFAKELPLIEVDELQIKFVILSLMNNGIDSMLAAQNKQPKLIVQTSRSSKIITVSVKDCGLGLPATLQGKIFNSYCRTKAEGTGLSLLICRGIIEAHNGYLAADNNFPESGANFKFVIPLQNQNHTNKNITNEY